MFGSFIGKLASLCNTGRVPLRHVTSGQYSLPTVRGMGLLVWEHISQEKSH